MTTPKELDTLIDDIHHLFEVDHKINEDNLNQFAKNIAESVRNRLEAVQTWDNPTLRVSKLGTPDRKLWYEMNKSKVYPELEGKDTPPATIDPSTCIKFMYGDIIEELLLLMIKETGHKVEGEQGEVEVDGIIGHRDCKIDGITVDIKSTSKYAFQKFEKGTLHQDDPFGYIAQISTYCHADNSPYGAFLAMNKETGDMALLKIDPMDMIHPPTRIAHVRKLIEQPEPPVAKCYPDKPVRKDAPQGNRELAMGCTFCHFKDKCWADANNGQGLRKFQYANGVKNFTHVVNTPRVDEVTQRPNEK